MKIDWNELFQLLLAGWLVYDCWILLVSGKNAMQLHP